MNAPNAAPLDLVDLVGAQLGGRVLACSDEFFAEASNLLRPEPAVWDADRYTDRGKWMDGWESRRRRTPGHDWCVIALGRAGVVQQLVIDTAFFTGNHPEAASVQACYAPGASTDDLLAAEDLWTELLPRTLLKGGSEHTFEVDAPRRITHVRLLIHPDGGVARLRVRGRVQEDAEQLLAQALPCELAALDVGGRVLGCSDAYFSAPANLLLPSRSSGMHDGWETRRRRGPGFDWVVLALGRPGRVSAVEIDTSHFKGNAPGSCELHVAEREPTEAEFAAAPSAAGSSSAADSPRAAGSPSGESPWRTLLPSAPLQADALHRFEFDDPARVVAVRLDIHPDGGVARLRVQGEPSEVGELRAGLARFDALDDAAARAALLDCCGCHALADALLAERPFADPTALRRAADRAWGKLGPDAWREALAAHPEIGERASGTSSGAAGSRAADGAGNASDSRAARWAAGEQASTATAESALLERLAEGNRRYRERFGFTYVICATGRTPLEMAALLERRLQNEPERELAVAAEEQRRITALRLAKLMGDP